MRMIKLSEANKAVKLQDGKLFIGTKEVIQNCADHYTDEKVPALYMVRVYDKQPDGREYPTIVAGLDLMKDGKVWLGSYPIAMWQDGRQVNIPSAHYDHVETVERILNTLCSDTIGKRWEIFEEEDFDAFDYPQTEAQKEVDMK